MQTSQASLSVLIVSWNQAERLSACLAAVYECLPDAQVVVVDNGSEPPLGGMMADEGSRGASLSTDIVPPPALSGMQNLREPVPSCPPLLLRSESNLGYVGGNNLGFAHCTGDYVLLLNNDALLPSAAPVEALMAFLEAHPQVAAAQAKLRLPDGTLDTCGEFLTPAGVLYHHGYRQPDGPHTAHPFPVFAAKGACLLLRRTVVATVGDVLFRPAFFCYYEDIDLCHRLWLAGHEVWFVPTEPVLHEEGVSARQLPSREVWHRYLTNMLTSALDLWGPRAWVTMGPGFLFFLFAGGLLKRTFPRIRRDRILFTRVRSERDLFSRITVHVPFRYYWTLARRRFDILPPCRLPSEH